MIKKTSLFGSPQNHCNHCDYEGELKYGVRFFKTEKLTKLSENDWTIPKYNFHYGVWCPKCEKWIKWEKQTDDICENTFWK
ncbi:MAG: hypothetical protein WC042_02365 [Candidatus Paceibacterota bacterium]|jgi:hypothetical protein